MAAKSQRSSRVGAVSSLRLPTDTHATRERMLPYHIWELDKLTLCSRYLDGGNRCLINSVFTVFSRGQSLSVRVDGAIVVCARLG